MSHPLVPLRASWIFLVLQFVASYMTVATHGSEQARFFVAQMVAVGIWLVLVVWAIVRVARYS